MKKQEIDIKLFILFVYGLVVTVLMLVLFFLSGNSINSITFIGILIYISIIVSWYFSSKSLFDVYLFFIILSFMFYLGQPILVLFGVEFDVVMSLENSPFEITQINKTLIYLLVSLSILHGSVLSFQVFSKNTNTKGLNPKKIEKSDYEKSFRYVGFFLLCISIFPQFYYIYESIKTTILFGYSYIFKSDYIVGSGIQGGIPRFLAEFFKSALLLIIISYLNNKRRLTLWIIFAVIYSMLLIVSGQRGSNTLFIVSLLFLYHYGVKNFTRKQIISTVFVLIVAVYSLSIISVIRNIGIANYELSELLLFFSNVNPFIDLLAESGFTLIACTAVMVYTPSIIPYNYGETYINSLIALVPNLFWDVNPAAVGGVDQIFKTFIFKDSGIGSSFIIEGYYNFGNYGLLLMPIFGLFIYKVHTSLSGFKVTNSYFSLFASVYCIPVFLWFVRSETINLWRDLGYHVFFPLLLVYLITQMLMRRKTQLVDNFK